MTNQRTNLVNGFATTLASPMGSTATSLVLTTASGLPSVPFYLVIDSDNAQGRREVILVDTSVVGVTLTMSSTAKRYLAGSAAGSGLSHLAGETVKMCAVEQLFDDLNDRISAAYGPGLNDVAVADGGTGSSTKPGARANLDLVYDVNVATPAAVTAAVAAEAALRTAADGTLTTNVATNTAGIATNAAAITTEGTTRGSADTTLQGNIDAINAASVAWTPTITGWTRVDGVYACWKHVVGKWCDFLFKYTVGASDTFGAQLSIPAPATPVRDARFAGDFLDSSSGIIAPIIVELTSGNFKPFVMTAVTQLNNVGLTATVPWVPAVGDVIIFNGRFETT